MDPAHKQILREKNECIVGKVLLPNIKQYLLEYKVFNRYMWEDIHTTSDVFKLLPTRGPMAFQNIICILRKANYNEQADILQNANEGNVTSFSSSLLSYEMLSDPLGYCLIINNKKFDNLNDRKGSGKNVKSLQAFFESVRYKVFIEINKKSDEMFNCVKAFSEYDFGGVNSAIVIIMSHGDMLDNKDIIFGTNGVKKNQDKYIEEHQNFILKQNVIELFSNRKCKQLQRKPKVFFFVSCRGEEKDDGVLERIFPKERPDGGPCKPIMPTFTDILIIHSTMPRSLSLCDENGSYFCQDLVSVLKENYKNSDLVAMIKLVNKRLKERRRSAEWGIIQPAEIEDCDFNSFRFKPACNSN